MANSFTYKYVPNPNRREANLFREEYYSSTDVRIFFDDEEQTEIASISYSINEQLSPIYGYKSRTWDDVAVGTRVVNGTIEMPIRNPEKQFYENNVLKDALYNNKDISAGFYEGNKNDIYNDIQDNMLNDLEWADTETVSDENPISNLSTTNYKAPVNTPSTNPDVASSVSNNSVSNNNIEKDNDLNNSKVVLKEYYRILIGYDFIPKNFTDEQLSQGIKKFQSQIKGLAVTGELDSRTRSKLLNYRDEMMKNKSFPNDDYYNYKI